MDGALKRKNKSLVIALLCVAICAIAIGYAALAATLTVNGTANISTTWKVEFTNITTRNIVGEATSVSATASGTQATFAVDIKKPTDSITYDITVKNSGSLSVRLNTLTTTTGGTDAIQYTVSGMTAGPAGTGTVLAPGGTATITVVVTFKSSVTEMPTTKTATVKVVAGFLQS